MPSIYEVELYADLVASAFVYAILAGQRSVVFSWVQTPRTCSSLQVQNRTNVIVQNDLDVEAARYQACGLEKIVIPSCDSYGEDGAITLARRLWTIESAILIDYGKLMCDIVVEPAEGDK